MSTKKTLSLLFSFLLFSACSGSGGGNDTSPEQGNTCAGEGSGSPIIYVTFDQLLTYPDDIQETAEEVPASEVPEEELRLNPGLAKLDQPIFSIVVNSCNNTTSSVSTNNETDNTTNTVTTSISAADNSSNN